MVVLAHLTVQLSVCGVHINYYKLVAPRGSFALHGLSMLAEIALQPLHSFQLLIRTEYNTQGEEVTMALTSCSNGTLLDGMW
jgi:hypothetical protein